MSEIKNDALIENNLRGEDRAVQKRIHIVKFDTYDDFDDAIGNWTVP